MVRNTALIIGCAFLLSACVHSSERDVTRGYINATQDLNACLLAHPSDLHACDAQRAAQVNSRQLFTDYEANHL